MAATKSSGTKSSGTKSSGKTRATVSSPKKKVTRMTGGASEATAERVARCKSPAGSERPAKRYLKTRPVCRVSFRLPAEVAPGECSVRITGDFNGWAIDATPMTRLKNGDYGVTVDLETGREYRFRYLIDGCRWENDWAADRYDPNPHGGFDSVVVV